MIRSDPFPSAAAGEAGGFEPTVADDGLGDSGLPVPAEERPLQALPTIGHVGRYALKYKLGEGGLGTVHAAIDPLLSRPIAIKTLRLAEDSAQRPALEALLLHEARAAAGLSHPHIVTVHDAGLAEEGVYIAMERLQGRDLRHLLAEGWRPQPRQAAQIVRRVADALAYAHAKGVVHCDIKPANIFMAGRTQPKVLDFGIARVAQGQAAQGDAPAAGAPAGSPYYMAPEQLDGGVVDVRSDVYSLGVVLYELLTGRRPFDGVDLDEIVEAVRHATPLAPHRLDPQVPVALSELCLKAMSRDPAQRPRSARQLSRLLRSVLGDAGGGAASTRARATAWAAVTVAVVASGLLVVHRLVDDARTPTPAPLAAAAPPPQGAQDNPTAQAAEPPSPLPAERAAPTPRVAAAERPTGGVARPVRAARAADREERASRSAAAAPDVAVATSGVVRIAVSPWGEVEVDGAPAGTTPPLTQLKLPSGSHTIVIRNEDFPPHVARVTVRENEPVVVRHRFGS